MLIDTEQKGLNTFHDNIEEKSHDTSISSAAETDEDEDDRKNDNRQRSTWLENFSIHREKNIRKMSNVSRIKIYHFIFHISIQINQDKMKTIR